MAVNFYELLQKGKDAADQVIQNTNEIGATLDELRDSLSMFLEMDVDLVESIEYAGETSKGLVIGMLTPRLKTGFNIVSIKHNVTNISRKLFSIKRASEGYPVTLVFDEAHYVADNKNEFDRALGVIISSSKTNLVLRVFKREVVKQLEKPSPPEI